MKTSNVRKVAIYGLFTSLAIVLSYVEMLLPVFIPVPGVKAGLANIVIISALYLMDAKAAIIINILRTIIVFLLFGNSVGLIYSLAGAVTSLIIMILLKKTKRFKVITISIVGAVSHNAAQIVIAVLLTGVTSLYWYLMVLWFTGIASGIVIGVAGYIVIIRLKKIMQ